jgi:hypothetical protein
VAVSSFNFFCKFKEQRNINRATDVLTVAALLLVVELAGEVRSFSRVMSAWQYVCTGMLPESHSAEDVCQLLQPSVRTHPFERTTIERCENLMLKYLKRHNVEYLQDVSKSNSVYLRNFMTCILCDLQKMFSTESCPCGRVDDSCMRALLRPIAQFATTRAASTWISDLYTEYNLVNGLLAPKPKKKMKPIAAVAINILLQRIMGKAFESARYAFNFAIVTPRTDVDYATTNYLIKKLANLHN